MKGNSDSEKATKGILSAKHEKIAKISIMLVLYVGIMFERSIEVFTVQERAVAGVT